MLGAMRPGATAPASSSRSRSAPIWPRPARSTRRCTRSSTSRRSSASTTSSARSRSTTSSPSGSPTGCSSRSGTAHHISYVQIDVPETLSIEGRAEFYEQTGAYRDMIVTHLFQVLGFVAMEPPTSLTPETLRDEKRKVFESLRPIDVRHVVRGQYEGYRARARRGRRTPRPRRSSRCASRSTTGAGPECRSSCAPARPRREPPGGDARLPRAAAADVPGRSRRRAAPARNELVIDFDDPGWITLRFLAKEPGPGDASSARSRWRSATRTRSTQPTAWKGTSA